jgi:flagellin FlaB
MFERFKTLLRDERGITALETAIILIAFVVVAAVFAFATLSAGMFSTEKSKEAIYAGLEEVSSTMELRGSVIALGSGTVVTEVQFSIACAAGGDAMDLTEPPTNNVVVVEYRDENQRHEITDWTQLFLGKNDGDDLLEDGELAEMTVPLSGTLTTALGTNTTFAIEVKPPRGGVVVLERTTPAFIDPVMDLH